MSTIAEDLQAIMEARYGRDVRQSIHDAIYDINEVAEGAQGSATASAAAAEEYATNALQSASNAETDATTASNKATLAESWAVGGTGTRTGEDTNNAKYWAEQAENKALDDLTDVVISTPTNGQVLKYDSAQDKWVNGAESGGGGGGTTDYTDLTNKPSINGVTLSGNKTTSDLGLNSVEANPSGSATDTLTELEVDGTVYGIPQGAVTSVNSQTGAVVLDATDINYDSNTTVKAKIDTKVDAVSGKGLSTEDYTSAEKTKLSGIETGAEVNDVTSVNSKIGAVTLNADDIPFDGTGTALVATDTENAIKEVLTKAGVQILQVTLSYYLAHKAELDASDYLIVISDSGIANSATNVSYDNTTSGLNAVEVQSAIDEVNSDLTQLRASGTSIDDLKTALSALSLDDFIKSKVLINDSLILTPNYYSSREYHVIATTSTTSTSYIFYALDKTNGMRTRTKATNGTLTDTTYSVTSWAIYY